MASDDVTFRYAWRRIQAFPSWDRGEGYNIGIFMWDADAGEYLVEIDPAAVRRSQWEDPTWFERWQTTPERVAEGHTAYVHERIAKWADKPLTDASIRKWLDYPYFGTYVSFGFVPGGSGVEYEDMTHRPLSAHLAEQMDRCVRPKPPKGDA